MKSFVLNELEEEDLKKFMEFADSPDENKIVYVYSGGGAVRVGNAILARCEREKVEMRLVYGASMGFDIFYNYTGPKFVENRACAVVHTSATKMSVFRDKDGKIQVRDDTGTDKQQFNRDINMTEPYEFLTDEEKEIFTYGGDIYLEYDRLKKIFKQD